MTNIPRLLDTIRAPYFLCHPLWAPVNARFSVESSQRPWKSRSPTEIKNSRASSASEKRGKRRGWGTYLSVGILSNRGPRTDFTLDISLSLLARNPLLPRDRSLDIVSSSLKLEQETMNERTKTTRKQNEKKMTKRITNKSDRGDERKGIAREREGKHLWKSSRDNDLRRSPASSCLWFHSTSVLVIRVHRTNPLIPQQDPAPAITSKFFLIPSRHLKPPPRVSVLPSRPLKLPTGAFIDGKGEWFKEKRGDDRFRR